MHRLLRTIGLSFLIVAGCTAAVPGSDSPSPSIDASVAPTATATTTATLTPNATPTPDDCPSSLDPGEITAGSIVIEAARGRSEVYVRPTGYRKPGGPVTSLPRKGPIPSDPAVILGGRDLRLAYRPHSPGHDAEPGSFESLTVDLGRGDRHVVLPVTLDSTGTSVAIPDEAFSGQLRLELSWSDECFTYQGDAVVGVDIAPSTVVEACGDYAAVLAKVFASQDVRVSLGAAETGLGTKSWQAKFSGDGGSDSFPAFVDWDRKGAPAVAPAGVFAPLLLDSPAFRATGAFLEVWRRADIAFDGLPYATDDPITRIRLEPDSNGVLMVPFPDRPGRYVVEIVLDWEHACMTGKGYIDYSMTAT